MRTRYQKPAIRVVETNVHEELLAASERLEVQWSSDEVDAGFANACWQNGLWNYEEE